MFFALVVAAVMADQKVRFITNDNEYAEMVAQQEKSVGLAIAPSTCPECMRAGQRVLELLQASSLQRQGKFFFFLLDVDAMPRLRPLYALEKAATLLLFMREQVEKLKEFGTETELRPAAPQLLSLLQRRMESLGRVVSSLGELQAEVRRAQVLFACLPIDDDRTDQVCGTLAEENLGSQFVRIKDAQLRKSVAGETVKETICVLRGDELVSLGEPAVFCQPLISTEVDRSFVTFQRQKRILDSSKGGDVLKSIFWKKHVLFFIEGESSDKSKSQFVQGVELLPRVAHFFVISHVQSDATFSNLLAMAELSPQPDVAYAVYLDSERKVVYSESSLLLSPDGLKSLFWKVFTTSTHLRQAVGLLHHIGENSTAEL